ncbi:hypothetical protein DPMN_193627 [Dreissena polymorpha]|uniref:Uncharacterized protein n=1 Tax=Dreissena polymorpha TaxID=45954 RepID=A0A9D3XWC2_DREPO|nr:hypothetical protein DPMN_193627 [Dreissena polymorpha]
MIYKIDTLTAQIEKLESQKNVEVHHREHIVNPQGNEYNPNRSNNREYHHNNNRTANRAPNRYYYGHGNIGRTVQNNDNFKDRRFEGNGNRSSWGTATRPQKM